MKLLILRPSSQTDCYDIGIYAEKSACFYRQAHTPVQEIKKHVRNEKMHILLLLPAEVVLLDTLEFSPTERRHLNEILPYLLEEKLIDDVDTLHCAYSITDSAEGKASVAVVERDTFRKWLTPLEENDLFPDQVVAEQQALPTVEQQWTGYYGNGYLLLKCDASMALCAHHNIAQAALDLLIQDKKKKLPTNIMIGVANDHDRQEALAFIPKKATPNITFEQRDFFDMVALAHTARSPAINLLQGNFALAIPWQQLWQQWQGVIVAGAIALTVLLTEVGLEWHSAHTHNRQLQQAVQELYSQSFANSPLPADPLAYLKSRLQPLQRVNSTSGFSVLLEKVGGGIRQVPGIRIDNINYNGQSGEMKVGILSPDFQRVTDLRNQLNLVGVEVKLINSTSDNNIIRANLSCRQQT